MKPIRAEYALAISVSAIAGGVFLARVPMHALLGWDTYPEILTSRILGLADFLGTFTEQTSEGFYPHAFYRPVFNLSLAVDYAIWGLEPLGYHLTTIALLCACGASLFWLSKRLLGPDAHWGPWVTLIAFLALPVHTEVVPLVSRRMDVLCGLFSVLALATQIPRIDRVGLRAGLVPAFFTALAVGSKESGVVVAPLVFVLAFCRWPAAPAGERLSVALRSTLGHAVVIAMAGLARFGAIGGLGGHPTTDLSAIPARLPSWLGRTLLQISSPLPIRYDGIDGAWWYALSALALLGLAAVAWTLVRGDAGASAPDRGGWSERLTVAVGASWIIMLAAIYAVTGLLQPWYLFLPGIGLSLILGAVAQGLSRVRAGGRRLAASGALCVLLLWIALVARYSPVVIGFGQWDFGAVRVRNYLDGLTARIESSADGVYLEVQAPQLAARANPSPIDAPWSTWIHVYSLPAWAELRFPERHVEFYALAPRAPRPVPRPGALVVGIRPAFDPAARSSPP